MGDWFIEPCTELTLSTVAHYWLLAEEYLTFDTTALRPFTPPLRGWRIRQGAGSCVSSWRCCSVTLTLAAMLVVVVENFSKLRLKVSPEVPAGGTWCFTAGDYQYGLLSLHTTGEFLTCSVAPHWTTPLNPQFLFGVGNWLAPNWHVIVGGVTRLRPTQSWGSGVPLNAHHRSDHLSCPAEVFQTQPLVCDTAKSQVKVYTAGEYDQ